MSIKSLRKKFGINIKRGTHVEAYSWSNGINGNKYLVRDFVGRISSVDGDTIRCKGHIWWLEGFFRFTIDTPNVVIRDVHGTIIFDSRESEPS